MTTAVISTAETASLLYDQLGPIRNWTHFLDRCRIEPDYRMAGMRLAPCAKLKDDRNLWRPYYSLADVQEFISAMQEKAEFEKSVPIIPKEVFIPASDLRLWSVRKLSPIVAVTP